MLDATALPTALLAIVGVVVFIGIAAALGPRATCQPEERRRVVRGLFGSPDEERRLGKVALLMALSAVVSVMGLSLDSPAVVIGAMLIAPLSSPLIGLSLAISMGWVQRGLRAGLEVALLCALAVAIAVALAGVLPDAELTDEILTRTSPDLRDLAVAFAAGMAGAYATVRSDLSAALPGVAVAVALVPPLSAAGMLVRAGDLELAGGAALLVGANLAAIVVSAAAVFLATGIVPPRRLADASPRVAVGSIVAALGVSIVAVPLVSRSLDLADDATTRRDVATTVASWLGAEPLELEDLNVDGTTVAVVLSGESRPPSAEPLARALEPVVGPGASVDLRWSQRSTGTLRSDVAGEGGFDLTDVERVADEWAAARGGLVVSDIAIDGWDVSVIASGRGEAPDALELADRLAADLGHPAVVDLRWTQGATDRAASGELRPGPGAEALARRIAADWAAEHGVELSELVNVGVIDGRNRFSVDLVGELAPPDDAVTDLERRISDAVDRSADVDARMLLAVELGGSGTGRAHGPALVADRVTDTFRVLGVVPVAVDVDVDRQRITVVVVSAGGVPDGALTAAAATAPGYDIDLVAVAPGDIEAGPDAETADLDAVVEAGAEPRAGPGAEAGAEPGAGAGAGLSASAEAGP